MKSYYIAFWLLTLFSISFAWTINPTQWHSELRRGETNQTTFTIYGESDKNLSVYIAEVVGNLSNWLSFNKGYFFVPANSSENFTAFLNVPANANYGNYEGKVVLEVLDNLTNLTEQINISVSLRVLKWVWGTTSWVKKGETLTVYPVACSFKLTSVALDKVGFLHDSNQYFLDLGESQSFCDDRVYLEYLESVGDYAKFKIQTADYDSWVNLSKEEEVEEISGEGALEPLVTKWIFKITEGTTKKLYVTVRNTFPYACQLKDIVKLGDVIETDVGSKPLDIGEVTLTSLGSGEEFTYPVEIDARNVTPDEYMIKTQLIAICNGKREIAETNWQIRVLRVVKPEEKAPTFQINYPESVVVNEEFCINVTGLPYGSEVLLFEKPEMNRTKVEIGDNTYTWCGYFTRQGKYEIDLGVLYKGAVKTYKLQLSVGEAEVTKHLLLIINPSTPKPLDTVTVEVKDAQTQAEVSAVVGVKVYENGELVQEFQYTAPFVVEANKKYVITATKSGYQQAEISFLVKPATARLIVEPTEPKVGKQLTIKYIDASGNLISKGSITVNGVSTGSPSYTTICEDKTYNITASAPGYETKTLTVRPSRPYIPPELISQPSEAELVVSKQLLFEFDKNTTWEIVLNGEVVASGSGLVANFTPSTAGNYTLRYDNTTLEFQVRRGGISIPPEYQIYILLALIAIVVYIKFFRKPKPPPSTLTGGPAKLVKGKVVRRR